MALFVWAPDRCSYTLSTTLIYVRYEIFIMFIYIDILSVYSPFSDRVGPSDSFTSTLPFPWVLMKSIGAAFFRPDALPDVNHMRGMQY